jgi:PEP-CTERM motif
MIMKKISVFLSMFLSAVLLPAVPAFADSLNIVLSNPVQTGTSDGFLTFDATVSAPVTNSGTLYLNGDSVNFSLDGSSLDDSDFYLNSPLSLDPGGSFTDALFTVTLPTLLAPGNYIGSFSIVGGSDPSQQLTLGTASFEVDAPSAVPEPSTWLLLTTGLTGVAMVVYGRNKAEAVARY